jgi:hypothetical protein
MMREEEICRKAIVLVVVNRKKAFITLLPLTGMALKLQNPTHYFQDIFGWRPSLLSQSGVFGSPEPIRDIKL